MPDAPSSEPTLAEVIEYIDGGGMTNTGWRSANLRYLRRLAAMDAGAEEGVSDAGLLEAQVAFNVAYPPAFRISDGTTRIILRAVIAAYLATPTVRRHHDRS
jgi:hypothetical protein